MSILKIYEDIKSARCINPRYTCQIIAGRLKCLHSLSCLQYSRILPLDIPAPFLNRELLSIWIRLHLYKIWYVEKKNFQERDLFVRFKNDWKQRRKEKKRKRSIKETMEIKGKHFIINIRTNIGTNWNKISKKYHSRQVNAHWNKFYQ